MPSETENGQDLVVAPKGILNRVRNFGLVRALAGSLSGVRRTFYGKKGAARTAFLTSLANVILVLLIYSQNNNQKEAADRLWSAEQIAIIYDEVCAFKPDGTPIPCQFKASNRSRENAVRAYVDVEGHKGTARLAGANLAAMSLAGVDFSYVDLSGATFSYVILTGANLSGATLVGSDLQNATLKNANLRRVILNNAYLEGANLYRANLRGARLDRAILGSCDSPIIDLGTNESYTAANLRKANLQGAVLTGASLCEADLSGADLTDVIGLKRDDLEHARGDEKTKLPNGFKRPERWLKKAMNSNLKQRNRTLIHPVQKESRPPK
jgi:uncharacterized protein YjbI with pentapeptide repeats